VQDADRSRVQWPAPYTWSQHAVRRVLGHTRVGPDPNQTVQWDALVLNEAVKLIHTAIAGYTFDGLIEPRDPRVNPRDDIRKKLEDDVKKAVAGNGIKVLSVGLSQFAPRDKEVDLQRIEAWKADWIRRTRIIEAEGQAERYRLIELARAQGQMELVMRIAQALEATQPVGTENADLIALRLLEVVERLAAQPDVGPLLSLEAREALSASRRLLGKGLPGDVAAST
jgi:regulator of protease activity HflC (stomatin/prohibitin superfamily)